MRNYLVELLKKRLEEKIGITRTAQRDSQDDANSHVGVMGKVEESQNSAAQLGPQLEALEREYKTLMSLKDVPVKNNLFSLITLTLDKITIYLFLSPVLGGEQLEYDGKSITVVSSASPLGKLLINAKPNAKIIFNNQTKTISKIEN